MNPSDETQSVGVYFDKSFGIDICAQAENPNDFQKRYASSVADFNPQRVRMFPDLESALRANKNNLHILEPARAPVVAKHLSGFFFGFE